MSGILAEKASVYREMRRGQLPMEDGKALIWALSQMRDTMTAVVVERLEEKLDGRHNGEDIQDAFEKPLGPN